MGRGGLLLNYAEKCAPPPVPLPLRQSEAGHSGVQRHKEYLLLVNVF